MKIGCSTYSFRNEWGKAYQWNLESFKALKQKYPEIEGWEVNQELAEKILPDFETKYLKELKAALNGAGFEWFALCGPSGSFGANSVPHYSGDEEYLKGFQRDAEFRLGFGSDFIENAAAVGVKFMRIDFAPFVMDHKIPYSSALDFNVDRNAETYRELCSMAAEYGIQIGIENHGGFASDLKVLDKIFEKVPNLKFYLDSGNVMDKNRYIMAEKYADRIHYAHAKAHVFKANGEEQNIDYGKIIGILKDKGFDGWLSIEWEGPLPGDEGVRKSIDLIKKYI